MSGNRTTGVSLFDLLARTWSLDASVLDSLFNGDDSSAIFQLDSGKLALVATQDSESPKARTRIEADTGRTTIRQRKNAVPQARLLPVESNTGIPVTQFGSQGFAAADLDGGVHHITPQGQCIVKLPPEPDHKLSALCSTQAGDVLAVARPAHISLYRTSDMHLMAEVAVERQIDCMAFNTTGDTLAIWGADCLSLIDINEKKVLPNSVTGIDQVTRINWEPSGSHLACATDSNAFWIIDTASNKAQKVEGYPEKVSHTTFSQTGKALMTSGAFRLTGWSTDDLPQDDQPGTPLTIGKSGLVTISTVAAHPTRSLVAVGYSTGLVTITSIGTTLELMVHKENATALSSLAWSSDGEHLSIGFQSGKAAVVTFPDNLFK